MESTDQRSSDSILSRRPHWSLLHGQGSGCVGRDNLPIHLRARVIPVQAVFTAQHSDSEDAPGTALLSALKELWAAGSTGVGRKSRYQSLAVLLLVHSKLASGEWRGTPGSPLVLFSSAPLAEYMAAWSMEYGALLVDWIDY